MKFCVLASGSSGNSLYIESGATRVLIDAGVSRKIIQSRLSEIGVELDRINALCVTHDHADHTAGIPVISSRHHLPLYATEGTCTAVEVTTGKHFAWNVFQAGCAFEIGELTFEAFSVPHDAGDPVGFVVSAGRCKLGIATDMGEVPEVVAHHLRGCNALVIEFNHDVELLLNSDRSWHLKQRILGRKGHLSNEQACELLKRVASEQLRTLFLAHLSEECNTPVIAMQCAELTLASCGLSGLTRICMHSWPGQMIDV